MNAKTQSGINTELLDDFLVEADEHLLSIRGALVQLEASVGKAQPDPRIVEALFREFHSLKGISAIVGLAGSEVVAHATEDFLRLLRGGRTSLTARGLEVLVLATQKLEQLALALRSQNPLPGYDSLLAEIRNLCGDSEIASAAPPPAPGSGSSSDTNLLTRIDEARARGKLVWKFTFSPSRELSSRGINVNSVRERLSKAGEILKSTPVVKGQGIISFEFLVAAAQAPTDLSDLEASGIAVQPAGQDEPAVNPDVPPRAGLEDADHDPFLAPSHIVRVDLKQLDELMRLTGETVIHRSRLDLQIAKLARVKGGVDVGTVQEVNNSLGRALRDLREAIMRIRLVPVAEIFARMPFVVRDLARQTSKKVRLKLEGQETSIDKYLIERLKDPLLHLVRNAFSHGVETEAERLAAGKSAEALIELKAAGSGDAVTITIRDDGKGINPNAIKDQATRLGLELPDVLDNAAILDVPCTSGFSTRKDVDRAAGRGVGMAVVQTTIRELGGSLELESEEGRGTQFTLRVPLSLAITEALIVSAAGQTCAVPQSFVRELLEATEAQIQTVNGIEAIPYRSGVLPIIRLAGLFQLRSPARLSLCVLVISTERGSVGLLTDQVLGQREVVVRALRDPLVQLPGIMGATELGDGKPVLILDGRALTSGHVRPPENLTVSEPAVRFSIPQ